MTENVESIPTRFTTNGRPACNHWILRKKRHCKLEAINGKRFCGEHLEPEPEDTTGNNIRIPCPLDEKHTIYSKNLKKHLKICNARPKISTEPYIVKDYNVSKLDFKTLEEEKKEIDVLSLSSISDEEFYRLIKQIEDIHLKTNNKNIFAIEDEPHYLVREQLSVPNCGKETRKHLLQVSSLLNILEKEKLFGDNTNFLELGAGKGQLAVYIAKLLIDSKSRECRVILVDRSNLRYKKDNKISDRTLVQRINADIRDLRLDKIPTMSEGRRCVALSKHLCGNGTDLAIRCITQPGEQSVDGIVMAFCCHHRCDWQTFVGKKFFAEHHFSERDFKIIIKMVSWAVCGSGNNNSDQKPQSQIEMELSSNIEQDQRPINIQRLSRKQRESIGFKCKDLLNHARAEHLRNHGYQVQLKQYVPRDVTMENIVLVAHKLTEIATSK